MITVFDMCTGEVLEQSASIERVEQDQRYSLPNTDDHDHVQANEAYPALQQETIQHHSNTNTNELPVELTQVNCDDFIAHMDK